MTTTSPSARRVPGDDRSGFGAAAPTARRARDDGPLLPGPEVRVDALDGLRALAVGLVVVYHVAPDLMPAGFLGVSLFFTLSGFLITRLLLGEHERTGTLVLRSFWVRRFRRLLPAALGTLAAVTLVWAVASWITPAIAGDVVASLAQVANWRFLATGTAYGAQTDASPVLHFWSLAIEEQFYLVYPLVVWAAVTRGGPARRRLGVVLGVLLAASLAYTLTRTGAPLTVYFSTFSRAGEVLVGALLAVLTLHLRRPRHAWLLVVAGFGAAIAVVVVAATSRLTDEVWARGGLTAFALLSGLAVLGATQPGAFARLLGLRPLVRIGVLSYGIYLFHWPILVALRTTDLSETTIAAVTVVGSVALAEASLRVLEQPIRTGRWRRVRPLLIGVPLTVGIGAFALWSGARSDAPTFEFVAERGVDEATATTPSSADPVDPTAPGDAEAPSGPLSVSIFGDSTAAQLRLALTGADPRIEVRTGWSDVGCPVSRGGSVKGDYVSDDGFPYEMSRCDWTEGWPTAVAATGSRAAVVYAGFWDTVPRQTPELWDGWRTIDDPAVAAHVGDEIVALTDALHEAGAEKVVWLTLAPHSGVDSEQNDRRTAVFNELLAEAAEARPEVMAVVDIAGWLATQPTDLRPDGVHFTVETGRQVIAAWLADELLDAAAAAPRS